MRDEPRPRSSRQPLYRHPQFALQRRGFVGVGVDDDEGDVGVGDHGIAVLRVTRWCITQLRVPMVFTEVAICRISPMKAARR